MQVVLGGELSATILAVKVHLTLTKWNTILMVSCKVFPKNICKST